MICTMQDTIQRHQKLTIQEQCLQTMPYSPNIMVSNTTAAKACALCRLAWHTSSVCSSLASSRSHADCHQPSSAVASATDLSPPHLLPMHPCTTPSAFTNYSTILTVKVLPAGRFARVPDLPGVSKPSSSTVYTNTCTDTQL